MNSFLLFLVHKFILKRITIGILPKRILFYGLGSKYSKRFNLLPKFEGYTEYNSEVDASVSNEHTTAAFRMGHSTIPDFLKIISDKKTISTIGMKDSIEHPLKIMGDEIPDSVIRGMSRMSMNNVDQTVIQEVNTYIHAN